MILEDTRNDFMQSIYDLFSDDCDNSRANQIIDIFDIATENCIELPCKVGDTVYYISPIITPRKIEEYTITGLCFEKTGLCFDKDDCRLRVYNSKGVITYFYLDFIGKTVFLTKEAAKQALRECETK